MKGLIFSLFIDLLDASPIEEILLGFGVLPGVVAEIIVAGVESYVIWYTTRSKALATIGFIESVVPGVDVIPFSTIAWTIKHGKWIAIGLLIIFLLVLYFVLSWLGWLKLPF